MANTVYNLDSTGQVVYPVNEGMSDAVRSTELAWSRIFYDSESMVVEESLLHSLSKILIAFTSDRPFRSTVP